MLGAKTVPAAVQVVDERQVEMFDNSIRARVARFFTAWLDGWFEYGVHL